MKRPFFSILFVSAVLALSLGSCGSRNSGNESPSQSEYETVGENADILQRMHDYHFEDTLRTGGHNYHYIIDRIASDSLPVVTDDEGHRFADNIYTLTIQRDGQSFLHRRFTKSAFASHLSADFVRKGMLDGMMLDRSLPGLVFAVSVSLPQSDMFEPLLLRIDGSGGIAIERDTRAENDFE